jgi:alpha-acetolactate decarboxylase
MPEMKRTKGIMITVNRFLGGLVVATGVWGVLNADENNDAPATLVQYGKMHEAIGQKQQQGRVKFSELLLRPHFFGVAALEDLRGEATIYDGKVTVTKVDAAGRLQPTGEVAADEEATLLVGAYVPAWAEHEVTSDVAAEDFDGYVAAAAAQHGKDVDEPFVFTIEGELTAVRLHVINGACPIHARLKKLDLQQEVRPFEAEMSHVNGTLVGVFAKDSVGNITHPATSTHTHILYEDPRSGETVTGHVEQVGLRKGSVLRLPK